jgi:hypothetical protein
MSSRTNRRSDVAPRLVARFALVIHVFVVAFTVLGGFLAWLLPWVFIPHLASTAWGARMLIWRRTCPLSVVENWGRTRSGRPQLDEGGFITHYFEGRLYPTSWARRVEILVITLVLGSWSWFAVR